MISDDQQTADEGFENLAARDREVIVDAIRDVLNEVRGGAGDHFAKLAALLHTVEYKDRILLDDSKLNEMSMNLAAVEGLYALVAVDCATGPFGTVYGQMACKVMDGMETRVQAIVRALAKSYSERGRYVQEDALRGEIKLPTQDHIFPHDRPTPSGQIP
jgi:hypothetical protein